MTKNNTCLISTVSIFFVIGTIIAQVLANRITDEDQLDKLIMTSSIYENVEEEKVYEDLSEKLIDLTVYDQKYLTSNLDFNTINMTIFYSNQCEKCGTAYQNPSADSNRKDLIIGYLNGYTASSLNFIAQLRSANSFATVVLFIEDSFKNYLTDRQKQLLEECGVIKIYIGRIADEYREKGMDTTIAHILFHEFLRLYKDRFSRVIIVEPAKCFIQSDPFTTRYTSRKFAVSQTSSELTNEQYEELELIDPHYESSFYSDKAPIDPFPMFGSVQSFLMFYGIVFRHEDFKDKNIRASMSAYINYFYHNGFFSRHNFKIRLIQPGDPIFVAQDLPQLLTFRSGDRIFDPTLYKIKSAPNPPSLISFHKSSPITFYTSCAEHRFSHVKPTKQFYNRTSSRYFSRNRRRTFRRF